MASRQFITLTPAASQAAPGPRGPARDRQDRSSRRRSRAARSEEHTSELQSLRHLVCRLLLEKKSNVYSTSAREAFCELAAIPCHDASTASCEHVLRGESICIVMTTAGIR